MSEISFAELHLENFCSIATATLDIDSRGLLLIQGENEDDPSANSNGSGKSSLVDGFCWTLYGVTARGVSGDSVVNRTAGKGCLGRVTFRDGTDSYTVTRHRKHKTGKNRLMLEQNGTDISLGTDKLTQEALEKILGCTHDVFVASIYAGQERMPNLPGMTDKELKTLVEEAAGVKVLERAYEIARQRTGLAEKGLAGIEATLAAADRRVSAAELEVQNAKQNVVDWEAQRVKRVQEAKHAMAAEVDAANKVKAELASKDPAAIQASIDDLHSQIAAVGAPPPAPTPPTPPTMPMRPTPPPAPAHGPEYRNAERARDSANSLVDRLEAERGKLAHELKHLNDKVGEPCGECGKPYAAEDLAGRKAIIAKRAKELNAELESAKFEVARRQEELAGLCQAHDRLLETHKRVITQQQVDYDRECAELRATHELALEAHARAVADHRAACAGFDTSALVARLRAAQNDLAGARTLEMKLRQHIANAQAHRDAVKRIEAEANPWTGEVGWREKAYDEALAERKLAREAVEAKTAEVSDAKQAADVFAPNGVRGEILDTVTPFLNDRTSSYLGALSDGNITAVWNTIGETGKGELREKFHIAVDNKNGADSFDGLSGGERRKVRIATAMALQDLVASRAYKPIKLFVADEIDDALDVSGLERLMGILEDKARAVGTVLLVSHNDLADWCRSQVTMVKKGGVSTLKA